MAKRLDEFGWGDEVIDENSVTSVSALTMHEDKKGNYHFLQRLLVDQKELFARRT